MSDLVDYVHVSNAVRNTLDLVSISSVTGDTRQVAARYEQMLRDSGCTVTRYDLVPDNPTLIAVYESPAYAEAAASSDELERKRAKTILLNGHMDVIPLPHEPARIENGRIYGRGTCDMKGSLACAIEVLRVLRTYGEDVPVRLMIVANSLHESPGGRGEDLIALTEQVQLQADAAIVLEGATRECTIAQLGSATFNITVRRAGETSHQLYTPEGTPHPIHAAADVIQALEQANKRLEEHYIDDIGFASYFIGSVHSGTFYNQFPVVSEIVGVRRYAPTEEFEAVKAEFEAILQPIAQRHGLSITLELEKVRDGYRVNKEDAAVKALVAAIHEVRGIDAPLVGKKLVTDAGILSRALGIPVLCHGPDAITAHGDVEYVEVQELELAIKTYLQFIEEYVRS
ncbi:M20 family metallopeptidase [Paenibacillus sp. GCM10027626]|uniref:M20 family metallopeptidase n=1 Tax=Paenibacillus sp. GCM10027626 TaxID=3273411 RepID=UPI003624B0E6